MKITIRYFASLKDITGKDSEELDFPHDTASPKTVFQELQKKYHFTFSMEDIKVAIDDSYHRFDTPLQGGETLVFIPPVAGG